MLPGKGMCSPNTKAAEAFPSCAFLHRRIIAGWPPERQVCTLQAACSDTRFHLYSHQTCYPSWATIYVFFTPRSSSRPLPGAITTTMIRSSLAPRILVIDDDLDQCALIQEQLVSGFPTSRIEAAQNADAAFACLSSDTDLIILDYNLPDQSGEMVLRRLKEHHAEIPVIVLTAGTSEPIAENLLRLGAHDFIIKGHHTRERLHIATIRAMETRRLHRQNQSLTARTVRQDIQLGVVNQTSRTISSILDPASYLEHINHSLSEDLGYEHIRMILFSDVHGQVELVAEGGREHKFRILEESERGQLPSYEGLRGRKASKITQQDSDGRITAFIPIAKDSHLIGVLEIQPGQGKEFDSSDIRMLEALAQQLALALLNSRLFSEIQRRVMDLGSLQKASQNIGSHLELEEICHAVYDGASAFVPSAYVWIVLKDSERIPARTLYARSTGIHEDWLPPNSEDVLSLLKQEPHGVILTRGASPLDIKPMQTCLVVPMQSNGDIEGYIGVGADEGHTFTSGHLQILTTLASHSASALKNARLYARVQHFQSEMVNTLVETVEAKSDYTIGHSNRVRIISLNLGLAIGLSLPDLETLERGAYLHDVGKISIPDAILDKPGPLTKAEYARVKTHPIRGQRILMQSPSLANLVPVVRHHHERWDGRGYPDGLAKQEIPLLARIVAVADTFDAMTSARPYRSAFPLSIVLEELKANAGKQHDPAIVQVLLELIEHDQLENPSPSLSIKRASIHTSRSTLSGKCDHAAVE